MSTECLSSLIVTTRIISTSYANICLFDNNHIWPDGQHQQSKLNILLADSLSGTHHQSSTRQNLEFDIFMSCGKMIWSLYEAGRDGGWMNEKILEVSHILPIRQTCVSFLLKFLVNKLIFGICCFCGSTYDQKISCQCWRLRSSRSSNNPV